MLISRLVGSQYVLMLQQEINTCFIIKQHCLPACQCAVEGERRRDGGDRNGRAESRCCPGDGGGGGVERGRGHAQPCLKRMRRTPAVIGSRVEPMRVEGPSCALLSRVPASVPADRNPGRHRGEPGKIDDTARCKAPPLLSYVQSLA